MSSDDFSAVAVFTLGSHGLLLFLALLVLLLPIATALWWLAQRYAISAETSALPAGRYLSIRLAAGFAVLVGAAAVFAEIAEELGDGKRVGELDQLFSDAVRDSTPAAALQVFAWVTRLGDTASLSVLGFAVALVLLLRGRRWLALGWVLAISGNALLNTTLKALFERTRPMHDSALVQAGGWSFPSGHSSGAVVFYGMLAYVLLRSLPPATARHASLPLVLLATALAFSVGCSRVFLQVHFATDVLAGFASGTAWLAVCVASIELTRYYDRTRATALG
ncbi:phosphatase PAP2 family protein [Polaromonas sp.]|uniref:phosphatase PAP2 family protein n=1 Tax=Polaromonas sp. TaxID=1869339 RepID=UPI00248A5E3C|nr:phosphatase PAP2 family protein [Polaromonas sp.]MDI1341113.1 phosphatase PAP2 family protein [Polaromonas sp.]